MKQVLEQVCVHAIPAFTDNYIWMMHDGSNAVVVDPGDAGPVETTLAQMGLSLCAIVLTHLHYDHCWGVPGLLERRPVPVYGPILNDYDRATHPPFPKPGTVPLDCVTHPVGDGDRVVLDALHTELTVIAVPGHTRGHLAFWDQARAGLYRGQLFAGGCGRVFDQCRTWRSRWTDWPACRSRQKSIAAMNTRWRICGLPLPWTRTTRRCLPAIGPSRPSASAACRRAVHHRAGKGHQPFPAAARTRHRGRDPRPHRPCVQHPSESFEACATGKTNFRGTYDGSSETQGQIPARGCAGLERLMRARRA